ncbi:hypothetical protein GGR95_000985 [Sulfitobacter undariae]|uniref:Uncharacterized protein n=1 Tax=Sulfitobacter undariae TaxID=1563671 RepID=A0A7W6E660_9RHOB|nr:hypothetical protein [Sulfitobacter undariae]MBB3993357.1 hypothetical protein [Sulfitobacter undariae]
MTFTDTYREEMLINRRARARRARFLGRAIGFGLTACFVVALRTEPQLRAAVQDLALAAIGGTAQQSANGIGNPQAAAIDSLGYAAGSEESLMLDRLGITGEAPRAAPTLSRMPQSRVKVNRPGSG